MQRVSTTARILTVACIALAFAACSSSKKQAEALQPENLYAKANKLMLGGDYRGAVRYYEALEARYPFAEQARQGRLDIMYAYYKAREPESAVDAADQFIRENPTHPRVDYAMYIKGLVYFEREANFLERWFNTDLTERPPQDVRRSFQAFQMLVERFPTSEYAPDSRQRMIFLRNRLAEYEVHVADYYLRREAWVAAIARARAEREAINAPIQGTAADIIKRAMIEVHAWLRESKAPAQLVMQVHDELVLEVANSAVEKVRKKIVEIMGGAAELAVALKVDTGIGPNWDDAH